MFDWLCEAAGLAGDVAKTYADALAEDGFDGPESWLDVPAEEQYLIGLGFKRGHAARVARILAERHAAAGPSRSESPNGHARNLRAEFNIAANPKAQGEVSATDEG